MSEEDKLKTNNEKVTIDDYYYYYLLKCENIINELEKDLYKLRELTFTKYNSNEWNDCLSFNDDILPIINKIKELKGSVNNEEKK